MSRVGVMSPARQHAVASTKPSQEEAQTERTAMIHELRIYTVKAGTVPTVAKNAGEVGRAIRGDNYGRLEGYWMGEIGPLNYVAHL